MKKLEENSSFVSYENINPGSGLNRLDKVLNKEVIAFLLDILATAAEGDLQAKEVEAISWLCRTSFWGFCFDEYGFGRCLLNRWRFSSHDAIFKGRRFQKNFFMSVETSQKL